jgi:hypothetical protein
MTREGGEAIGVVGVGAPVYWLRVRVRCGKTPNKPVPLKGVSVDSTVKELKL